MSATRRTALLILLGLAVSAVPAYAGGGGGTKRPSRIEFINNSSLVVGVTIDATSTGITTAITNKDVAAFINAGGKFISVGGTASFHVGAGTYTVGAIDQAFANAIVTESVTVAKGQTIYVTITDNPNTAGAIEISSSTTPPTTTTTTTATAAVRSGRHN